MSAQTYTYTNTDTHIKKQTNKKGLMEDKGGETQRYRDRERLRDIET